MFVYVIGLQEEGSIDPYWEVLMKKTCSLLTAFLVMLMLSAGCTKKEPPRTIKEYPLNSADVITRTNVAFDPAVSVDGKGSVRVDAPGYMVVNLYEATDADVDNARLVYRAKVKTKDVEGRAFLEMRCVFPGKGEYFSRGLDTYLTGTNDWTTQETPFFLKKGQKPEVVKLNLVITGKGTVWIDDIKLIRGRLR